jgi:hypothetical protein
MSRNYQIIMFLLIVVVSSCSGHKEGEIKEEVRFDPYDSPEISENEVEPNSLESIKNEIPQIEFRDERKANPDIDSLLKIVEQSITNKDIDALLTTMDTNVISSYGGGMYGHDDFRETWQDDNYRELWAKLDEVISLGGFFANDSTYCAPYTGNVDEEASKVDDMVVPYGCGISTHTKVKLYPSEECDEAEAINIGRTYCMIKLQGNFYGASNGLWKVNPIGTDVIGYVKTEDFYCSADYGLVLEMSETGGWKITAFAPWD